MQPHQARVVAEKLDLDIKIEALGNFIQYSLVFDGLGAMERFQLSAQLEVMKIYSTILGSRIAAFAE